MSGAYPEFRDAHIVVTGAAAGIGRATTLAFAREGARISALDIDADGLTALAGSEGIEPIACDIADPDALADAHARAERERGPVRAIVNNAGVDDRRPALEFDAASWRRALALNLDHHFLLSALVAPAMAEAGGGAIVNLSSTAWMKMAGDLAAYHAAKAGIVGLTRGLAREWGARGIRVNAVAPGRVVTERVERDVLTDAWAAETRALQCLPKLIRPADVADCVLWLASSRARMVTGQTVIVDGGVV